ncbi:MAG: THUMP domain-containing protein [Candidatus Bathyarchaeia archaeon]
MVLRDFNLLISTSRGNEGNACSEAWFLLGEIGDREALVEKTNVVGLIVAKTILDPFKVIEDLRRILKERPEEFRYILRVIPVELVTHTNPDEIKKAVAKLSSKILEGETFRVTVEKRHSDLSTNEIINAAASVIERRVDLEKPDKIVLIEVVGGLTGISIIRPKDVLSIIKEKSG